MSQGGDWDAPGTDRNHVHRNARGDRQRRSEMDNLLTAVKTLLVTGQCFLSVQAGPQAYYIALRRRAELLIVAAGFAQKVIWALFAPASPPDVRQGYALPLAPS